MKKIYWDKGHRNTSADYGASGNGLREADLTHKIVEYAMAYLDANYTDFEQRTNRKTDEVISLPQRTDQANAWGADVYISVHINAAGGTGFESFIYQQVGPSTIALQNMMHNEILAAMRQFGQIQDRGKKRGNFHVIRESHMDAVLTENLFIDSADANLLKKEEFLKAVGEAHARGVAKFMGLPAKQVIAAQTEPKQEDIMSQKFEPSNQAIRDAVSTVLSRFEQKDPALSANWREKANAGKLTINDAVGLLYVAVERGYITGGCNCKE